jgi:hypothetical protein
LLGDHMEQRLGRGQHRVRFRLIRVHSPPPPYNYTMIRAGRQIQGHCPGRQNFIRTWEGDADVEGYDPGRR